MKKRLLLICFSIFIFSVAAGTSEEKKSQYENPWFQTISNYEPILTPITGAIVCGSVAGGPGVALGLFVGVIDESLIYAGYTSEKHLTMGLLTGSMAATLNTPYYLAEILGFGLGVGLSSGVITAETSQLVGPVSAAMAGASYSNAKGQTGTLGALGGGAAFLIDKTGLYNGTYLCDLLKAKNTAAVITPAVSYLISIIPIVGHPLLAKLSGPLIENTIFLTIIIFSYGQNSPEDTIPEGEIATPEQLKQELDKIITRVTGTNVISKIQRQQVTYKIGTSILTAQLARKMAQLDQNFIQKLGDIAPQNFIAQASFNQALMRFGVFLFPYVTHSIFNSIVSDYQSNQLKLILKKAMREKIMSGESPLYLKAEPEIESDVKDFEQNLNTIAVEGIQVVWSTSDTYTVATHSSLLLFKSNALDIATFLGSYSSAIEIIVGKIISMQNANYSKIKQLNNKIAKLEEDIKQLPKLVVNGRKLNLLQKKIYDLESQIRQMEADNFNYNLFLMGIKNAQGITNSLVSFSLITSKATSGDLDKDSIFASHEAARNLLASGNWYLKNQATINTIQKSQQSLNRVLDYLDKPCDKNSTLTVGSEISDVNSIQLTGFKIGIIKNNQELLTSEKIEIPAGRYVVTGKSGSGKSSFLSKIRGIICNGIYAHGDITYKTENGLKPEVYEVTQEDYITPYSSLLEVITGQTSKELEGNEAIRIQVRDLLLKLKIDDLGLDGIAGNLDEERSWGDTLSGGQKRKIAIAALLLKKPSFVILDETFAGLDAKSIQLVQELIYEELSKAVILIVDHQPQSNNYNGFYQQELRLENKTLRLIPFSNRTESAIKQSEEKKQEFPNLSCPNPKFFEEETQLDSVNKI